MMGPRKITNHTDLAKLPVTQKINLCNLLDQNDNWEALGRLMQFSDLDIVVSFNFKGISNNIFLLFVYFFLRRISLWKLIERNAHLPIF